MSNLFTQADLLHFTNLELLASKVVEGFITGLHKSPFHGFSVEFAEHRLYNTGESTRHIDWKLFGRSDKLFVKRYEEETNLRCQIVIDNSSSMYYPPEAISKIRFSVIAAASLIQLLRKQRDASGLSIINSQIDFHSASKVAIPHIQLLYARLNQLLQTQPNKTGSNLSQCLHQLSERLHQRSLVVIFSDFFVTEELDKLFNALQHLRYNKHEVIVFNVTDLEKEDAFDFENRPYAFVDSETGEQVKLNPVQIKEGYLQALQSHKLQIQTKCHQHKIDWVDATVGKDFNQILLPFLIKRSKLG